MRDFTERLNASMEVDDILGQLVEQLEQTSHFARATGVSLQGGQPEVRVRRIDGRSSRAPFREGEFSGLFQQGSPLEGVLAEGAAERCDRIDETSAGPPVGVEASTGAYFAAPLNSRGETFGALLLERDEPDPFTRSEVGRIKMYASQVGVALEKAMLATVDPLTSLYNRRKFFELAGRALARAIRYRERLSVLMLDIDDFKEFNDTYGHATGDAVLEEIAGQCRASLRETDIVGRYGGEEFVALLPSTPRDDAEEAADRLRRRIAEQRVDYGGDSLQVTVSIGVASRREADEDIEQIIERADRCLYAAKNAGKDQVWADNAV